MPPLLYREHFQPDMLSEPYTEGQGRSAHSNRMTSINININNLEEKKDMRGVKVKMQKPQRVEEYAGEDERNYRA